MTLFARQDRTVSRNHRLMSGMPLRDRNGVARTQDQRPEDGDGRHLQRKVAPSVDQEHQSYGNTAPNPGRHALADAYAPGSSQDDETDAQEHWKGAEDAGLLQPLQIDIVGCANIPKSAEI